MATRLTLNQDSLGSSPSPAVLEDLHKQTIPRNAACLGGVSLLRMAGETRLIVGLPGFFCGGEIDLEANLNAVQ